MYDQSWDKTLRVRRPLFVIAGTLLLAACQTLRVRRPLFVIAGTLLLAACQTNGPPAVSLEEAKQITASFEGGFTPPPKTIKDITAILDAQKPDAEVIEKRRETADAKPPPGMRGAELAKFLWKRGLAAGKIGDARRQLADMKEAAPLSKGADQQTRMDILFELAELPKRSTGCSAPAGRSPRRPGP